MAERAGVGAGAHGGPASDAPNLGRLLFGGRAVLVADDPRAPATGLYPEERHLVRDAVPRRQRELAAGRRCARRALARCGVGAGPLLPDGSRAPRWPAGWVGSITHTETWCAAAVGPAGRFRSIGLDAEPAAPLDGELWATVLTPEERQWLAHRPPRHRGTLARLLFSAKEAAFKCQYPITRALLDFEAFAVEIEGFPFGAAETCRCDAPAFRARLRTHVAPFAAGAVLPGRFVAAEGLLITAVALAR